MGEWIMDLYSVSGDSTDHEYGPLLQWDHEPRQDPQKLPWTTDIHMASAGRAGFPHQYGPLWYLRRENYSFKCFLAKLFKSETDVIKYSRFLHKVGLLSTA